MILTLQSVILTMQTHHESGFQWHGLKLRSRDYLERRQVRRIFRDAEIFAKFLIRRVDKNQA